ncbi:hypothetical protein ACFQRL_04420 [Microbacterium fluvii]|uniref:DUF4352 domain-containing protein n=1 Tax=Microbacterium fluvii TaxID=415215 RepID=A0ABW2HE72_9MICO|nr:hypothetical protein [Microbacterium fluvii]MCU4671836.1 hypothetical protein [Microbacterium fluvii]
MTAESWAVLKDVGTIAIAFLSLVVALGVAVQASKWRPRPLLQFRFDQSAGRVEKADLETFLDRAEIAKSGVVMVNAYDFMTQPEEVEDYRAGLLVTIANHGNGPAFDVELHVDIPRDTSAAHMALGDLTVIRRSQLLAGEDAKVVLAEDLKYGTPMKGGGRWTDLDVWGIKPATDGELVGWLTWREPPRTKKVRRRKIKHTNKTEMGDWV